MTYRISLKANPKVIIPVLLVPLLPALGVLAIIFMGGLLGIVILVLGVYFSYHLVKFLSGHLRSSIETGSEGLHFHTQSGEQIDVPWGKITYAGVAHPAKGAPFLYVYADEDDKLLTVPPEYGSWEQLVQEVREHADVEDIQLADGESIETRLKMWLSEGRRD